MALEDRRDPLTGAYLGQDLAYYAPGLLFGREIRRVSLEDGEVRYRWIAQTGSLILIGTNEGETTLYRTALDLDAFCDDGQALVKSTREYPVYGGEGVYQALETGRRMVYLSRSGKAFVSDEEGQAQELYPARILERLMYPFFLASNTTESVIIGEKDSGDILTLSLQDGSTNVLRPGTESFPGMGYQTADLSAVSMRDIQNYTGAVAGEEGYTLIVCWDGAFKSFNRIRFSLLGAAWDFFSQWILWSAAFLILGMGCLSLVQRVCAGRTILMKLLWTAGTLIVAVDLLFGAFSFFSYRSRVLEELCQQAQQEGALLMQMVDEEDWHGVEYPYDYGNACYRRMSQSLAQQQPEGRTAYYEEGQLYTGAGEGTACFYPVETLLNASLTSLYQEAALSGQASVGRVQDARGERVVCITPSGGLSGSSVYLVETGVYLAQLKTGLSAFLLR